MANRRIEMNEYQEALHRMRLGQTDRAIGRDRILGRRKVGDLRALATRQGWLAEDVQLPTAAQIVAALAGSEGGGAASVGLVRRSSVEPFAERIRQWFEQGVQGVAIHAALVREYGFTGHYSSVRRFLDKLKGLRVEPTMILEFAPGEAAQVDFGAGPMLIDPDRSTETRTWFFVMTLCFSRHQYVEFVFDQSAETWQRCHHRALRHFGGVPSKIIIDNPKCAITRAVIDDPEVHRAYAECAQGYGFIVSPCPPADAAKKALSGRSATSAGPSSRVVPTPTWTTSTLRPLIGASTKPVSAGAPKTSAEPWAMSLPRSKPTCSRCPQTTSIVTSGSA